MKLHLGIGYRFIVTGNTHNNEKMKQVILNNWTFARALRVIIGLVIIVEAIQRNDVISTIAGSVFTALGLFNISCCGSRGCALSVKRTEINSNEVSYERLFNALKKEPCQIK
ncbi:MAG: hypothetical protein NVSMB24_35150 [Mucilaginibacter sp.]